MEKKFEDYVSRKNVVIIIIVLLVIILLLVFTAIHDLTGKKTTTSINDKAKKEVPTLVVEASKFYTVTGCVDKYLGVLSEQDPAKIYLLLTPDYLNKNNITEENVLTKVDLLPNDGVNYTFDTRKMYQQKVSDTLTKYYIFGYITKNLFLDEFAPLEQIPAYYIVVLDEAKLSFSIMPYSGKIFK